MLPLVLGQELLAGSIALEIPGEDAFARCFESLARNEYKTGLEQLRMIGSAVPAADMQVLIGLCKVRLSEDPGFDEYRVAVGAGIRMYIPALGQLPIAFDFAIPIQKEDGDESQVFSFTAELPF